MNDTKIFKNLIIVIIFFTLTFITLATSQQNEKLEAELYETKQELATQRFYNRLMEQQLHQMKSLQN